MSDRPVCGCRTCDQEATCVILHRRQGEPVHASVEAYACDDHRRAGLVIAELVRGVRQDIPGVSRGNAAAETTESSAASRPRAPRAARAGARLPSSDPQAAAMSIQIFTIGHSNHSLDRFVELLNQHGVKALVDVRRYPSSRRRPHFNRPQLVQALEEHSIEYTWLESLGGHRKRSDAPSPNHGIRNESLRAYADHMLTDEFRAGIEKLLEIAAERRTAIMCAEARVEDCHRNLTSDFLVANGTDVQHILATGELKPHLASSAKVEDGTVTYPERLPLFDGE